MMHSARHRDKVCNVFHCPANDIDMFTSWLTALLISPPQYFYNEMVVFLRYCEILSFTNLLIIIIY